MRFSAVLEGRWRKAWYAVALVAATVIGSRLVAPGIDGHALAEYFRAGGAKGQLALYNWLTGGALARGAILALSILPYVSARIWMWVARTTIPAVRSVGDGPDGHHRLARWTRLLTATLAAAQSVGFALFAEAIPGVVAAPGPLFVAKTAVILTAGVLCTVWATERLLATDDGDDDESAAAEGATVHPQLLGSPAESVPSPLGARTPQPESRLRR